MFAALPFTELIIALLSLLGWSLAVYIFYSKRKKKPMVCLTHDGTCNSVTESQYSTLFGFPVELLGALYYLFIFAAQLALIISPSLLDTLFLPFLLIVSTGALGFSLYLTGVQMFALREYCMWCLTSANISLAIFILEFYTVGFPRAMSLLTTYAEPLFLVHMISVGGGLVACVLLLIKIVRGTADRILRLSERKRILHASTATLAFFGIALGTSALIFLLQFSEHGLSDRLLAYSSAWIILTVCSVVLHLHLAPRQISPKTQTVDQILAVLPRIWELSLPLIFAWAAVAVMAFVA